MAKILVTGCAGFIGFHLCRHLLDRGDSVTGIDNLNDYYSVQLKRDRLKQLTSQSQFQFQQLDLADRSAMSEVFSRNKFPIVLHLAAQAGVRYSLQNPHAYVESNLAGFVNILECCRHQQVQHLVYASSSSVYGANTKMPFSVHDNVDHPLSLYAATKKSNELLAHTYSHLFGLPTTGLRFFTVYGPWGRPDMALYKFTESILAGRPIDLYNYGKMRRDFTYVDDIVQGVIRTGDHTAQPNPQWRSDAPDPGTSAAPYRIYNIGNHQPVELSHFIQVLEGSLGKKAQLNMCEMQPGDVPATYADVADLMQDVDFQPKTPIEEGIPKFVSWYREYHRV